MLPGLIFAFLMTHYLRFICLLTFDSTWKGRGVPFFASMHNILPWSVFVFFIILISIQLFDYMFSISRIVRLKNAVLRFTAHLYCIWYNFGVIYDPSFVINRYIVHELAIIRRSVSSLTQELVHHMSLPYSKQVQYKGQIILLPSFIPPSLYLRQYLPSLLPSASLPPSLFPSLVSLHFFLPSFLP